MIHGHDTYIVLNEFYLALKNPVPKLLNQKLTHGRCSVTFIICEYNISGFHFDK